MSGYRRTGWCEPRAGSAVARVRDRLLESACGMAELEEISLSAGQGMLGYLRDQCGYIIEAWRDPSLPRGRRGPVCYRYRITGRLAWGGGVGEDYTCPAAGKERG